MLMSRQLRVRQEGGRAEDEHGLQAAECGAARQTRNRRAHRPEWTIPALDRHNSRTIEGTGQAINTATVRSRARTVWRDLRAADLPLLACVERMLQ